MKRFLFAPVHHMIPPSHATSKVPKKRLCDKIQFVLPCAYEVIHSTEDLYAEHEQQEDSQMHTVFLWNEQDTTRSIACSCRSRRTAGKHGKDAPATAQHNKPTKHTRELRTADKWPHRAFQEVDVDTTKHWIERTGALEKRKDVVNQSTQTCMFDQICFCFI